MRGSSDQGSSAKPRAELIISNARVWTVDPRQPEAEAVAILGERIVAVGSAVDIDHWRGDTTRVIRAAITPPGEWITGGEWDEQAWVHDSGGRAELPTRYLIDDDTREVPVLAMRMDVHMALANSAALNLIGITRDTPDPPGGEIVRDARGEPTGILKDAAMSPAYAKVPPISHERRMQAVRRAVAHAASVGITSVQDMKTSYEDMAAYAELADSGELTVRVYSAPPIAAWENPAKLGLCRAFGSSWLRYGAVKAFADGSLGSTTACMFEPYLDAPHSQGLLGEDMIPLEKIHYELLRIDRANMQVCVHAIGDRAVSTVLDLFAEVNARDGLRDRRFRIEHAQHVAAKDFARFRNLQVIASMQPYHAIDDGRWAETRISPELLATSYAWRTMLDNHVRLAFGSDWPVAPLAPLTSIYAAVTRATHDGKHPQGWYPEQKLRVAEAIEAYTIGSAYAEFQDNQKGSITAGKLADLVLLSHDLFSIEPESIQDVTVDLTIVGGRVVYQRGGSGGPAKSQSR